MGAYLYIMGAYLNLLGAYLKRPPLRCCPPSPPPHTTTHPSPSLVNPFSRTCSSTGTYWDTTTLTVLLVTCSHQQLPQRTSATRKPTSSWTKSLQKTSFSSTTFSTTTSTCASPSTCLPPKASSGKVTVNPSDHPHLLRSTLPHLLSIT